MKLRDPNFVHKYIVSSFFLSADDNFNPKRGAAWLKWSHVTYICITLNASKMWIRMT